MGGVRLWKVSVIGGSTVGEQEGWMEKHLATGCTLLSVLSDRENNSSLESCFKFTTFFFLKWKLNKTVQDIRQQADPMTSSVFIAAC